MCRDHQIEPLPHWLGDKLEEYVIPIQCLPPLGIHERCEHDPNHVEPSFNNLTKVR